MWMSTDCYLKKRYVQFLCKCNFVHGEFTEYILQRHTSSIIWKSVLAFIDILGQFEVLQLTPSLILHPRIDSVIRGGRLSLWKQLYDVSCGYEEPCLKSEKIALEPDLQTCHIQYERCGHLLGREV